MILVRDVFKLKYGQARPALALFKESRELMTKFGHTAPTRVMTDLVGSAYTLVLEQTHADLAAWEHAGRTMLGREEWQAWFHKFTPLVESGYREIFTIVD